jgi:hypothetical protein
MACAYNISIRGFHSNNHFRFKAREAYSSRANYAARLPVEITGTFFNPYNETYLQ